MDLVLILHNHWFCHFQCDNLLEANTKANKSKWEITNHTFSYFRWRGSHTKLKCHVRNEKKSSLLEPEPLRTRTKSVAYDNTVLLLEKLKLNHKKQHLEQDCIRKNYQDTILTNLLIRVMMKKFLVCVTNSDFLFFYMTKPSFFINCFVFIENMIDFCRNLLHRKISEQRALFNVWKFYKDEKTLIKVYRCPIGKKS